MKMGAFFMGESMIVKHFYCIKDEYFERFKDKNLKPNKGVGHGRPCFFAVEDAETGLFWAVPVSSKVEKYKKIYCDKIARGKTCDTIVFGEFMGDERAFLLQNMAPVSEKYVDNEYIDRANGKPARVGVVLENILIKKARRVLWLVRHGKKVVFPDVLRIEEELLKDD